MNRAEALRLLRIMLTAAQKTRSDLREGLGEDEAMEMAQAELRPWLFGPKSIVPSLAEYIGRAELGKPITGAEFYNFMWVAHNDGLIVLTAHMIAPPGLPEPDLAWHGQVWS